MESLYGDFLQALKNQDKEKAMEISMAALESGKADIKTLYEEILAKALNSVIHEFEDEDMLIWQEHVRSSIVLSVIENSYTYVLKEKEKLDLGHKGKVLVFCPKYEDHIIGPRMAADIFTIAGYQTTFIGANTPFRTLEKAIEAIKPDIISIGVTNFYNLIETRKTIEAIREKLDYKIKIVLSGYAFKNTKDMYKEIGGDMYVENLGDIFSLSGEVDRK